MDGKGGREKEGWDEVSRVGGGVVCISEGFEVVGERGTRANHGELGESGWG